MIYAVIQDDLRLTAYAETYVNDVGIARTELLEQARRTGPHPSAWRRVDLHIL